MPSHSRFLDLKAEHGGSLLLFKIGDFYEAFFEDAKFVAQTCGLTVTQRTKKDATPMTGFPHWGLESHLQTLHDAGFDTVIIEKE